MVVLFTKHKPNGCNNQQLTVIFVILIPNGNISMNKTAMLVADWAVFEEQHPEATLEDFYRHSLSAKTKNRPQGQSGGQTHSRPQRPARDPDPADWKISYGLLQYCT